MEVLRNVINYQDMKLCFLCFKKHENLESISTKLYIYDENNNITSSISKMMTYLFPSREIVYQQVCTICSNLILSMYLTIRRYDLKNAMYSIITETLSNEVKKDIKATGKPFKIHVKLPALNGKESELITQTINSEKLNSKEIDCVQKETKSMKNNATVCWICGKSCKTPNTLKAHLNCHYFKSCPYCSKTLKSHSHFKIHVKCHEGVMKIRKKTKNFYYCNDCEYRSLNKCSLEAHKSKYHVGERPFVCDICTKGFYKKSNLTEHVMTHTKVKNLICEQCGDNFVHKKTLAEHQRLHSGEKPFECNVCKAKFITSGRRSDHFKRKHGEKNECCSICSKKYSLRKDLNSHFKKMHTQNTDNTKVQFLRTDYEFLDHNGDVLPVLTSI